ncbi:WHG domain-containing protein, partial [Streptomyces albidoflavus]|uniref:TetR-like C-terminal domain-containing protein n=1 Tax=Streptomyces albidoflavus TaxID=1886 RepID=UPI000FEE0A2F
AHPSDKRPHQQSERRHDHRDAQVVVQVPALRLLLPVGGPVLGGPGLAAVVDGDEQQHRHAVALEGAAELATSLRAATGAEQDPRARVTALARAYLAFAARNPAVYDAVFQLDGGLAFAREDTPEPLQDAFAALLESLGEVVGDGVHPGLFTEVFWASLHGLATLGRAGRLPPGDAESRMELLVDRLAVP